jgi:hypothetical protein
MEWKHGTASRSAETLINHAIDGPVGRDGGRECSGWFDYQEAPIHLTSGFPLELVRRPPLLMPGFEHHEDCTLTGRVV